VDIKDKIYPMIKPLAGVYMIINLVTGDIYIGSAITGKMANRFHKHLFGFSGSKMVAAAVMKNGLRNFAFIVVDTVPKVITTEENKELLALEDHYLSILTPMYNIALTASNSLGVKHTDTTKVIMRLNYSSERRERIGALNRGKNLSPSTIEAIRKAALTRGPITELTRTRVSVNSMVANLYAVNLLDGTNIGNVRTISSVALLLGCHEKTVRRALKSNGIIKQT
jgi:group I intron endonuclease